MNLFNKIFNKKNTQGKTLPTENQNNIDLTLNNTVDKIYRESVEAFINNYENPDIIYDKIFALTNSEEDASLIFLFIPHFFCRLFIPEVEYTDFYILENPDKSRTEIKFKDSKKLTELYNSIERNWDEYLKMEFTKVLFHSGDFRAINQMLHNGSKIEDLQAVPPFIPY